MDLKDDNFLVLRMCEILKKKSIYLFIQFGGLIFVEMVIMHASTVGSLLIIWKVKFADGLCADIMKFCWALLEFEDEILTSVNELGTADGFGITGCLVCAC